MDMRARHQDQLVFHLTGKRKALGAGGDGLLPIDGLGLRPALLAPYRDLDALRHDFPLVLETRPGAPQFVHTLSGLVDAMLSEVAPRGIEGERLRRHALALESEIRRAVAAGARGTLSELWSAAAASLGKREGQTFEQVLTQAGAALQVDGEVLGCSSDMPARLVGQAWRAAQRDKARRFHADLGRLVRKLSDILRAAFTHSSAGRLPQSLKASVGGPHQDQFDFEALSRILGQGVRRDELPARRRERLQRTLAVLEAQRFFAPPQTPDAAAADGYYNFAFDNCSDAVQAFRDRLPQVAELIRAMAVAELEATGHYIEDQHDLSFEAMDAQALTADDLAPFPDYLVCIPPERNAAPENALLIDLLSSGLPVKVLVQTSDLMERSTIGTGHYAFGVRSTRLATTAMGLGGMFAMQASSSNLYALRARLMRGLTCRGPALLSVFCSSQDASDNLPPYLVAAAAMQSRAFPAFSYDAGAGANWAERFSLENNPQPDDDWPLERLDYADTALQRASASCAFTFADFMLCDPRQAAHFALVPRALWSQDMLPAAQWLAQWLALGEQGNDTELARRVPYLLAVDAQDALQRVLVDAPMMQAARRSLLLWRRLQEHAGIHDSHAERLLAREKALWAAERLAGGAATPAPVATTDPQTPAEAAPAHTRDEAWIETARCPSCNECNLVNARMFAYDERKQAFIKDIGAGSYRDLVEAAESCQVAIIHPGKPLDPNEPGLEQLLARAEPFR